MYSFFHYYSLFSKCECGTRRTKKERQKNGSAHKRWTAFWCSKLHFKLFEMLSKGKWNRKLANSWTCSHLIFSEIISIHFHCNYNYTMPLKWILTWKFYDDQQCYAWNKLAPQGNEQPLWNMLKKRNKWINENERKKKTFPWPYLSTCISVLLIALFPLYLGYLVFF